MQLEKETAPTAPAKKGTRTWDRVQSSALPSSAAACPLLSCTDTTTATHSRHCPGPISPYTPQDHLHSPRIPAGIQLNPRRRMG